jgi:Na+-transporting NADH:ubiquinone oxidoreductase subunit NqrD
MPKMLIVRHGRLASCGVIIIVIVIITSQLPRPFFFDCSLDASAHMSTLYAVITRCGRRVAIGLKKLPIVDIPAAKLPLEAFQPDGVVEFTFEDGERPCED